jgi:hypothetical protein
MRGVTVLYLPPVVAPAIAGRMAAGRDRVTSVATTARSLNHGDTAPVCERQF